MPGVRIQHATEADCLFTLVDGSRPYNPPFECALCGRTHAFKTYHFRLDAVGAAVVSTEIAERLRRLPLQGGFAITGEVARPPAQRIRLGQVERVPIVSSTTLVEPT